MTSFIQCVNHWSNSECETARNFQLWKNAIPRHAAYVRLGLLSWLFGCKSNDSILSRSVVVWLETRQSWPWCKFGYINYIHEFISSHSSRARAEEVTSRCKWWRWEVERPFKRSLPQIPEASFCPERGRRLLSRSSMTGDDGLLGIVCLFVSVLIWEPKWQDHWLISTVFVCRWFRTITASQLQRLLSLF